MPKLRRHNLISHPKRTLQVYPKKIAKMVEIAKPDLTPSHLSVAKYGWVWPRKGWKRSGNDACHAGLRYGNGKGSTHIVNGIMTPYVPDKISLRFLEWLLNYSPYKDVFITKSPKTALRDKIIVASTEFPSNLVAGGLFASRAITEHYARIAKVWNGFLENGVHPDVAFMYAHKFSPDPFGISPMDWHVAIDGQQMPPGNVLNFLKNIRKDGLIYKDTGHYQNIHDTWKSPNKEGENIKIHAQFEPLIQELARGKNTKNPFDRGGVAKAIEPGLGYEAFGSLLKQGYKAYV